MFSSYDVKIDDVDFIYTGIYIYIYEDISSYTTKHNKKSLRSTCLLIKSDNNIHCTCNIHNI